MDGVITLSSHEICFYANEEISIVYLKVNLSMSLKSLCKFFLIYFLLK